MANEVPAPSTPTPDGSSAVDGNPAVEREEGAHGYGFVFAKRARRNASDRKRRLLNRGANYLNGEVTGWRGPTPRGE